jgi:hypothetical protein
LSLWAAIKKSVNSNLNVPLDTLIKDVQTTAESIANSTERGIVKSVQRGTVRIDVGETTTVTITSVLPTKCSVTLYGAGARYGDNGDGVQNPYRESAPYVTGLTNTTLKISTNASSGSDGITSWEIIEYY